MNTADDAAVEMKLDRGPDLATVFHAHYERIARLIDGVIKDPGRAEELAVEVFLKSWNSKAASENSAGWLHRVAIRIAIDELRRQARRSRYEQLMGFVRPAPSPHEAFIAGEEQHRIRFVLSVLDRKQAELILLRSQGFSYSELASALQLNPASVGTLLSRAQEAFRKEYTQRYGEGQDGKQKRG